MKNITIINQKPYRLIIDEEENLSFDANTIDQLVNIPTEKHHVIYYRGGAAVLLIGGNHEDVEIKEDIDIDASPLSELHVINAEYNAKKGGLVVKRVQEIIFR